MDIESTELKMWLLKMLDGGQDTIGTSFDRGIKTALSLIDIMEHEEGKRIANGMNERGE